MDYDKLNLKEFYSIYFSQSTDPSPDPSPDPSAISYFEYYIANQEFYSDFVDSHTKSRLSHNPQPPPLPPPPSSSSPPPPSSSDPSPDPSYFEYPYYLDSYFKYLFNMEEQEFHSAFVDFHTESGLSSLSSSPDPDPSLLDKIVITPPDSSPEPTAVVIIDILEPSSPPVYNVQLVRYDCCALLVAAPCLFLFWYFAFLRPIRKRKAVVKEVTCKPEIKVVT